MPCGILYADYENLEHAGHMCADCDYYDVLPIEEPCKSCNIGRCCNWIPIGSTKGKKTLW